MTPPGSILGTAVRRVEDPELRRRPRHLRRQPRTAARATCSTRCSSAARSPTPTSRAVGDRRRRPPRPAWSGSSPADDLGERPVPMFASVERRRARASRSRADACVRRRPGRPGRRRDTRPGRRRGRAGRRRLRTAAGGRRPGGARPSPGAPQLHDELPRNVAIRRVDEGDPLDDAEVVVRARIENNRLATAPIEGNAILADPTGDDDRPPAHGVALHPAPPPRPAAVRPVHRAGHGSRSGSWRPTSAARSAARPASRPTTRRGRAAALALGRPVAWTETRSEAMLSMHGRGQVQYAELGLTRDGPDHRPAGAGDR